MQLHTPYRTADAPWPPRLGSHRAIVRVNSPADAVRAHIVWRRRDLEPERKEIVVMDRATGKAARNRFALCVTQESGEIVFQPPTVPGEYEVYYLPFDQSPNWGLDAGRYRAPEDTADGDWRRRHEKQPRQLPAAEVVAIECRTPFDNADPMGRVATESEVARLLELHPGEPYLLFPTPRELPIRMDDHLPVRWIETGPSDRFIGEACRNEYFAFQIGVFAAGQKLGPLAVSFGGLRREAGSGSADFQSAVSQVSNLRGVPGAETASRLEIGDTADWKSALPSSAFRCFNLGGVDCRGRRFEKSAFVERARVQALWFGVDVPNDIAPGEYTGSLRIQAGNAPAREITIQLTIRPETLADRGDGEPWRHSRLRWLDSTIGLEEKLVPPFTPVRASGRTVRILDRTLRFGANGLPARIESRGQAILHSPMRFEVCAAGKRFDFARGNAKMVARNPTRAAWASRSRQGDFLLTCRATMEFDGFVGYQLSLRAQRDTFVDDVQLQVPLRRAMATYMMGMGHRGGPRPARFDWRWDWSRHQDSVWIGDTDAGLRVQLRDETYEQPLRVKYLSKPLQLPRSWHNAGYGGCTIREAGKACVLFQANCGARAMAAGEELRFDFTLLITPCKPLDPAKHFRTRHFHSAAPVARAVEQGLNNITIHHATAPYPSINYPFLTADQLRAHADEARRSGLKLRTYYTVRELTNHVPELWALRSLGGEVFLPGEGGGHAWLQENLVRDYSPNWYNPFPNGEVDAAITEAPSSRWHNYWLEGLRWLIEQVGIDGIYIDDTNLDRVTMQRARRILVRGRPGAIVDFHSNDMHWGFYGVASTANVYMELFPYLDSLWFGESYDYLRTAPGYWLTEISGIPFGLMGEVMPYDRVSNPWRAVLYGLHARLPVANPEHDPQPIFRVWDEFGIADARMIGYWDKACPVRTDHPDVLASAFVRRGRTLIALASWAEEPVRVRLRVDWKRLGLHPGNAVLRAARIEHFQEPATFRPSQRIPVAPGRGWMLVAG